MRGLATNVTIGICTYCVDAWGLAVVLHSLTSVIPHLESLAMAFVRCGGHSTGRTVGIISLCAEEQLYGRLASHAFASTSQALSMTVPSNIYRPSSSRLEIATEAGRPCFWPFKRDHVLPVGINGSHRHEQAAASASVRHFSSSSQTLVASQQAEGPPLNHAATAPLFVSVLEKALRDQFPLGPPPQVAIQLSFSLL